MRLQHQLSQWKYLTYQNNMTSVIKLFGNSAQTFFVILFLVLFLSSCSSLSSLKFWGDDELDSDEPRPLQEISNIKNLKMDWNLSFAGENFLGNFVPAFSANNIFLQTQLDR